jgi:serine/threonine-protein kinase HipA
MKEGLYIHLRKNDGSTVLVGQCVRSGEHRAGLFKYSKSYLARKDSFALDPINFPLQKEPFSLPYDKEHPGIPGFALDCGPDSWGRQLLRVLKRPPPDGDIEMLLASSGTGIGALRFTTTAQPPPEDVPFRPFETLDDVVRLAKLVNEDPSSLLASNTSSVLFLRGSSLGGARPKTLILHDDTEWLVKFPKNTDAFDNPLVEHVTMTMARSAGINAAETKTVSTSCGNVLLVKRFDIDEKERVSHVLSLNSLINTWAIKDIRDDKFCYQNIASIAQSVSKEENIGKDVFRRMIYNIAIGNTDDHMRNHAILRDAQAGTYKLSPVYDVVTNDLIHGSHVICVGPMGRSPSKDNILGAATQMGVKKDEAIDIIQDVLNVTSKWKETFLEHGVSQQDIDHLDKYISYGLSTLNSTIATSALLNSARALKSTNRHGFNND